MKFKTKLLASASTKEKIIEMINKFYCSKDKYLMDTEDDMPTWLVFGSNKEITSYKVEGVRVVKRKNRFRFEYLID